MEKKKANISCTLGYVFNIFTALSCHQTSLSFRSYIFSIAELPYSNVQDKMVKIFKITSTSTDIIFGSVFVPIHRGQYTAYRCVYLTPPRFEQPELLL